MADTIYSYYSVNVKSKRGKLCIRLTRPPMHTYGILTYKISYAFCSPNDNFSKREARKICDKKVRDGKFITIESDVRLSARKLSDIALNTIHFPVDVGRYEDVRIPVPKSELTINIPTWFINAKREDITPHKYKPVQE